MAESNSPSYFAHIFIMFLFFTAHAQAGEPNKAPPPKAWEIGISAGQVDLNGDAVIGGTHIALMHSYDLFEGYGTITIGPRASILASNDGGLWGGIGVQARYHPTDTLFLQLGSEIGWQKQGDQFNMRHPFNFRQQLGLGYQLSSQDALMLSIAHFSNARLGDRNPGVETLMVNYIRKAKQDIE